MFLLTFIIEFVGKAAQRFDQYCQVHERKANQKTRVAANFCHHATTNEFQHTFDIFHNITENIFHTKSKLPEKIVADEVLGDFDNVVDVESGSARCAAFRTIVLGHPQYSDHIVTRSVNISDQDACQQN